ncbi:gamma-aminobutyraldehyde dehydrogenase, partial [Paenibacillus sp. IB182496]|nr:gamma-aminobutyraldehyde dehydrogenase [Paenibacillus sabuli]
MKEILNYIGGKWQAAASGKTTINVNPASGEQVGRAPVSAAADAEAAAASAQAAA